MRDETRRDDATESGDISRGDLLKKGIVVAGTAAGAMAGAGLLGAPRVAFGAPALLKKTYKIAIVPKALNNPVFNTANWGGETRAMELGNVSFKFTGSVASDAAVQATVVDGLIDAGYDAIGISCNAPEPLKGPIDRAVQKGIVVMCWDSDSPQSKRSVFYGLDNFASGQALANQLNTLLGSKKGDVWILSGSPAAQNLNARIQGIKAGLAKGLNVRGVSYCNDDIATSVTEVNNILRINPNLVGYLMAGAWPLFTSESATPELKKRAQAGLEVVALDFLQQELQFLAHGTVKALVGQDYWGWGYQSVQIMYQLLQGKHYPAFVKMAAPVVTRANYQAYVDKWKIAQNRAGAEKAFHEAPLPPM